MNNLKIIFGVCGIGHGHIYEMLPIIEHYAFTCNARVVIFSFKESYKYFSKKYNNKNNILVLEVAVPWIHGSYDGINYNLTAKNKQNKRKDYISKNFGAMNKAKEFIGKPSIVISNYEPVSAMYAYSIKSKFITVDQQSKYFLSSYPSNIAGLTPWEERSRLRMFFPYADLRIINSFFKLSSSYSEPLTGKLVCYGPIIRNDILSIKKFKGDFNNVLVYLSPYSLFVQKPRELLQIFKKVNNFKFYIFSAHYTIYKQLQKELKVYNVYIRRYNEEDFLEKLKICRSVVSSAGHTLLSELIYLGKPVWAIPLNTYEQHYSARIIHKNHCGITTKHLNVKNLRSFLNSLHKYEDLIKINKNKKLYQKPAQIKIIKIINSII